MKLRLFQSFAALILLFGVLSGWFGIRVIQNRVVEEAQNRVRLDLGSAWSVYEAKLNELRIILELASNKKTVGEAFASGNWENSEAGDRLEATRRTLGLDFLTVVGPDGRVLLRTVPPYARGDFRRQDPALAEALQGRAVAGVRLFSPSELDQEGDDLVERAFLTTEETPHARPTPKTSEPRGMVMIAAVPIKQGAQLVGALYGGILLNRNFALIDHIHDVVYRSEAADEDGRGTATIFLNDSRIATTVRLENGLRAIGTRASKEVADRVLDNGLPWVGRAFVVRDWYLTAYEPIRDLENRIVGMLYVGILEKPFRDLGLQIVGRYVGLTAIVVLLSLAVAFVLAGHLALPIHRLVKSAQRLQAGEYPQPVSSRGANWETRTLIDAFNAMVEALKERQARLSEANENLRTVNRSYMETLSFVTHELNAPVASMMNYVYLLRNELIGPLQEKQRKAVGVLDVSLRRIMEMIRHYLNLARIERGELSPAMTRVDVRADVIDPLLDLLDPEVREHGQRLENEIPAGVLLRADVNMTREIFENLLSNAVKYGREGGCIRLQAESSGSTVLFSVRNDGDGIPPERLKDLFRKFSRVEREGAKHQGTGLGLFITRNLVEAHGGTIEAVSKLNEWVEFKFALPRFEEKAAELTALSVT